jgi:regulator of protease activity HflC (stomatin/prohibitin superfamily)
MRSEIGKIELDRTFEEREKINSEIVMAVDKASLPWGLKVTRHEIKNIVPPTSIKDAMEKQMRAEREKRALIAESEGEGRGQEIERVAMATAKGIREIANAISEKGGIDAVNLRIAESYLGEFGKLAQKNNAMIIPSNLSDVAGVVASIGKIFAVMNRKETEGQTST